MNISIIGAGHVGRALASALGRAGHDVVVTSAHLEHAQSAAADTGAKTASSSAEAASGADVIILAVPAQARAGVAAEIADLVDGVTVVDATNVLNADMSGLATERSGAEDVQDMLPTARVVKAFNTVFASRMSDPSVDGVPIDGFYAGDDPEAKAQVKKILGELGYRPIDAGPLSMARALEDMALLIVRINALGGGSWSCAWKLLGDVPEA